MESGNDGGSLDANIRCPVVGGTVCCIIESWRKSGGRGETCRWVLEWSKGYRLNSAVSCICSRRSDEITEVAWDTTQIQHSFTAKLAINSIIPSRMAVGSNRRWISLLPLPDALTATACTLPQ